MKGSAEAGREWLARIQAWAKELGFSQIGVAGVDLSDSEPGLLRWLEGISPRPATVFVNHGDDGATKAFVKTLRDEHGYIAHAPYSGTVYDLASGSFVYKAEPRPILHTPEHEAEPQTDHGKKPKAFAPSAAYIRLAKAGEAVQKLIARLEGAPNKTLNAFAEALEKLVEKYR